MVSVARAPHAPALKGRRVLDLATESLAHPVPEECVEARAGRYVLTKIRVPV